MQSVRPGNPKKRVSRLFKKTIVPHIILVFFGLLFLFPFFSLVMTALKSPTEIFELPPELFPKVFHWENFKRAFEAMPFFMYLKNTLFLCIVNIVGYLISAPLVAYSISKIQWKGKKPLFLIIIATMILPPEVTMIPVYIIYSKLGWINTYLPLTIGSLFGGSFNIFLIRQFMMGIPNELMEAAKIDGAGELRIYGQIIYPLLKPVLTTIAIFTFTGVWNDFMGPLIYLNNPNLWTISVGLQGFMQEHGAQWELLMASATIFTIPSVLLYFIGQKHILKTGSAFTGLK
ncbi:carbohydrate ABC transporter permease [Heyndrickxia acidicola]|uniref:Carbohydrate ABC transporter permease n=1 Tax=Heyndrickxia acidicola TaxID=209389 RepID=A0ABU6MHD1_9BACI|nr:carbohydrate ABC transporter permease [Heyndrickxia acidicola]MED1203699.1 carbohydrate ABC transporter permease [Heyndrickxia acidicola]